MTRFGYVMTASVTVLLTGALSLVPIAPRLIWNASASAPIGLYAIDPSAPLEVTDLVAVEAPEPLATFLSERGYLPRGVPLMKRVAAVPGQRVCRSGVRISVDDIDMGEVLERDRLSRPLPVWRGCRVVAPSELFLMNWQVRDSLDGRYFGPLPAASVMGRATPLYTDEDGDGRFVLRAPTR